MAGYTLDLEGFKGFCERQGIEYRVRDEPPGIVVPRPQSDGWALQYVPRVERSMATLAYPLPGTVPPERREELARACNLLNARTYLGAWVLNTTAGELYFRQTITLGGVTFEDEDVKRLLQLVIGTVELNIQGFDRVLEGAPAEAVLPQADADPA